MPHLFSGLVASCLAAAALVGAQKLAVRLAYYVKLRALVQSYHFPLIEFKEHDEDPAFLYLHRSHLTAKGWIYYDHVLDDFYHERLPLSL